MTYIAVVVETPDILIFFGRFHPLVVHLPIGFLILAIIFEWFSMTANTIRLTWLLGAISAALAATLGYLLSLGGDYNEETLSWHMWSGITLTLISFLCFFLKGVHHPRWLYLSFIGLTALLLTITGHQGGSLTHGSEYLLEYAPVSVRKLVGWPVEEERPPVTSLDSADVFLDAIMPIMRSKCTSCHNQDKRKGKLLLTSYEAMLAGGESGPAIVPGSLDSSEVFRRITLPSDHEDFMPAEGKRPLTDAQVSIIEWWIISRAPGSALIASLSPDEKITELFNGYFGLASKSLDDLYVPPVDTAIVDSLRREGFIVNRLSSRSNFLDVVLPEGASHAGDLRLLTRLKEQVAWLHLSHGNISDDDLEVIGQLTNLRRLNLSRNPVSDTGIKHLLSLLNLEYLNLYETKVTDNGVRTLTNLPSLKSLFVWQTEVTRPVMDSLLAANPKLNLVYLDPDE